MNKTLNRALWVFLLSSISLEANKVIIEAQRESKQEVVKIIINSWLLDLEVSWNWIDEKWLWWDFSLWALKIGISSAKKNNIGVQNGVGVSYLNSKTEPKFCTGVSVKYTDFESNKNSSFSSSSINGNVFTGHKKNNLVYEMWVGSTITTFEKDGKVDKYINAYSSLAYNNIENISLKVKIAKKENREELMFKISFIFWWDGSNYRVGEYVSNSNWNKDFVKN